MRWSSLTYNVCLDLSCLLCINLRPATGREVTERQMRTSSAVWRMVAAVPPGHGDGTTSIQPLRSLKCRGFWLCQHCSAQCCSNSPDHCQKPRRKNPENRRRKCWCIWSQTGGTGLAKGLLTIHWALNFLADLRFRQTNVYCQAGETQKDRGVFWSCSSFIYLCVMAPLKVCTVVFRWPVFIFLDDSLCTLVSIHALISLVTLDVPRDVLLSFISPLTD